MNTALEHIRKIIKEEGSRGLTQTEIAAKVGMSQASIFKYLEQDVAPTLKTIMQFSRAYNISLSDFTGGEIKELKFPHPQTEEERNYVYKLLKILRSNRERFKKSIKGLLDDFAEIEAEERQVKAHNKR